MSSWDELSMAEKADVMKLAIEGGVYDLDAIRSGYNEYAKGGRIHIKPSHRGRLTELKKRTGKSEAELYRTGSSATRKMITFARNARKWKHGLGGNLYEGDNPNGQQMQVQKTPTVDLAISNPWLYNKLYGNNNEAKAHAIYLDFPNFEGGFSGALKVGSLDVGAGIGKYTGLQKMPFGHAGVILVDKDGNSDYYEYGRYNKVGNDEYDIHTFGDVKKGKGNWRTTRLPKQEEGENDSVYVARIQEGLPDAQFGTYQAMSLPNVDVEKAKAYINQQAHDPNRRSYGAGNTCVDGAYRSIIPFMRDEKTAEKILGTSPEEYNTEGYAPFAQWWSTLPWSVGNTSAKVRKVANKTYIMNKKK